MVNFLEAIEAGEKADRAFRRRRWFGSYVVIAGTAIRFRNAHGVECEIALLIALANDFVLCEDIRRDGTPVEKPEPELGCYESTDLSWACYGCGEHAPPCRILGMSEKPRVGCICGVPGEDVSWQIERKCSAGKWYAVEEGQK